MSATSYPRPVFASIDEIRVGMVVLTHSGRRLTVTSIDRRRGLVTYTDSFHGSTAPHTVGFPYFVIAVESVVE